MIIGLQWLGMGADVFCMVAVHSLLCSNLCTGITAKQTFSEQAELIGKAVRWAMSAFLCLRRGLAMSSMVSSLDSLACDSSS